MTHFSAIAVTEGLDELCASSGKTVGRWPKGLSHTAEAIELRPTLARSLVDLANLETVKFAHDDVSCNGKRARKLHTW